MIELIEIFKGVLNIIGRKIMYGLFKIHNARIDKYNPVKKLSG